MFERYTEKARRAIFFARHEASQNGSPYIETGHLLLGILREGAPLFHALGIQAVEPIGEDCRKALGFSGSCKVSTSVDLPLSNASKRVLTHAAEEAERLQNRNIGLQHLLLGLLHEEDEISEILKRHEITLEKVRGLQAFEEARGGVPSAGFTMTPIEFVCHGQPVGEAVGNLALPWPRIGETIVLGEEERRELYKVVDVSHFYAYRQDQPQKQSVHLVKIVVTLDRN